MKNMAGREIPESLLEELGGKEVYQGVYYRDGYEFTKDAPTLQARVKPQGDKVVASLREAIEKSGLKDGMTISFHHHFRDGDYVCNMVMEVIREMGIKDLYICASSVGAAQSSLVACIEDGTVTGLSTSGIRAGVGKAVSQGKLKTPAIIRSHGGRVRAIETGEVHIDVAFIGASTADRLGNASGKGGKSDCGVLAYADVDARYADHVVVVTDTLVPTPNSHVSIKGIDVDSVVVVDKVGDPNKIASGALRVTQNPRELMIAENVADAMSHTPYFKDGFSFQTGAGGASLAVTRFLKERMDEKGIKMGWALGGITGQMVELMEEGYIGKLMDTQSFDVSSVSSVHTNPNHMEITTSQYANPFNKGAYVNYLDFVILGALEVDTDFNVNVVQGSDGLLQGAPGGHVDTSAGSNVSIIVTPLIRSRIPCVRDRVTNVTTPGDSVDIIATDYGIAINPRRKDLMEALEGKGLPLRTIEELRDEAYSIVGEPKEIQFDDQIVAVIEYRDGTILDVVRKPKNLE